MTFLQYIREANIKTDETELFCDKKGLTDLNGIEQFTNLELLSCGSNKLEYLPNLDELTNLRILCCSDNYLKWLPNLNKLTELIEIDCMYNRLEELPNLEMLINLDNLFCSGNNLPFETEDKKGYPKSVEEINQLNKPYLRSRRIQKIIK